MVSHIKAWFESYTDALKRIGALREIFVNKGRLLVTEADPMQGDYMKCYGWKRMPRITIITHSEDVEVDFGDQYYYIDHDGENIGVLNLPREVSQILESVGIHTMQQLMDEYWRVPSIHGIGKVYFGKIEDAMLEYTTKKGSSKHEEAHRHG